MAQKMSATGIAGLVVGAVVILIVGYCIYSHLSPGPTAYRRVSLEQFLSGVSLDELKRLKVKDVQVGDESVKDQFQSVKEEEPSLLEVYFKRPKNEKTLTVIDKERLKKLGQVMAVRQTDHLKVTLRDDHEPIVSLLLGESWYQKTIEITTSPTPCEKINRIIYEKMSSLIQDRIDSIPKERT